MWLFKTSDLYCTTATLVTLLWTCRSAIQTATKEVSALAAAHTERISSGSTQSVYVVALQWCDDPD
jgi:hypothetical protein